MLINNLWIQLIKLCTSKIFLDKKVIRNTHANVVILISLLHYCWKWNENATTNTINSEWVAGRLVCNVHRPYLVIVCFHCAVYTDEGYRWLHRAITLILCTQNSVVLVFQQYWRISKSSFAYETAQHDFLHWSVVIYCKIFHFSFKKYKWRFIFKRTSDETSESYFRR